MNRRKKYKIFILCWLALDLMTMAWLGYRYLDRQIPDELQISRGETVSVSALLDHPLVSFEEAIEVSADGSYTLPCKILGYIPFKSIKVTPVDDKVVYVAAQWEFISEPGAFLWWIPEKSSLRVEKRKNPPKVLSNREIIFCP